MKLYRVSIGHTEVFAAGIDAEDVYNRRESLDHTFGYLPIVIEEVKLDGYEITVNLSKISKEELNHQMNVRDLQSMDRDSLKLLLKTSNIEFIPQWGDERLRELILAHIKAASVA